MHDFCLVRIGITAVGLVRQPFAVRIGFDVEITLWKAEGKRGITALFYQPTVRFPCSVEGISLGVDFDNFIICRIFLENHSPLQFQKLLGTEAHYFAIRVGHKCTAWHAVPLGKDGRYVFVKGMWNVNRECVAHGWTLRATSLAIMIDGLHLLSIGIFICRIVFEVVGYGIAIA